MDTRATVELPTTATDRGMFFAMILTTDGAWLHTDRADRCFVNMAYRGVFSAERVTTIQLLGEMFGAERLMAEVAMAHAVLTALFATLRTGNSVSDQLAAMGAFFETIQTIGSATGINLEKAWAYLPFTFATGNQAVGTEALTRGATDTKLRAVLLATRTTNSTVGADQRVGTVGVGYGVGAQMAATLARATFNTRHLAR